MKIMDGDMLERRFAWPEGHKRGATHPTAKEAEEMILTGETRLTRNDVAYMHGKHSTLQSVHRYTKPSLIKDKFGLHQMVNSNANETCVSLHLYSPPIPACKIFDPANGACKTICSSKIDSKQGIRLVTSPTREVQELPCMSPPPKEL